LPSKTDLEKNKKVANILNTLPESATKWLNNYNETLKTVDDADSPVEWIISVAKLTEGWDVKRVFQIIPHEKQAFNSRLLIAQVQYGSLFKTIFQ
jgi:type III restriction enzyme